MVWNYRTASENRTVKSFFFNFSSSHLLLFVIMHRNEWKRIKDSYSWLNEKQTNKQTNEWTISVQQDLHRHLKVVRGSFLHIVNCKNCNYNSPMGDGEMWNNLQTNIELIEWKLQLQKGGFCHSFISVYVHSSSFDRGAKQYYRMLQILICFNQPCPTAARGVVTVCVWKRDDEEIEKPSQIPTNSIKLNIYARKMVHII